MSEEKQVLTCSESAKYLGVTPEHFSRNWRKWRDAGEWPNPVFSTGRPTFLLSDIKAVTKKSA